MILCLVKWVFGMFFFIVNLRESNIFLKFNVMLRKMNRCLNIYV